MRGVWRRVARLTNHGGARIFGPAHYVSTLDGSWKPGVIALCGASTFRRSNVDQIDRQERPSERPCATCARIVDRASALEAQ